MSISGIGILGAGSVGCFIGGFLAAHGVPIQFVGRHKVRKQLEGRGLYLSHIYHDSHIVPTEKIHFSEDVRSLTLCDTIFVCVKSGSTETVAQQLAEYIAESTTIVSLQNGVTNTDVLRKHLPNNIVLTGIVGFNVLNKGDGHFHCGTEGEVLIEDHPKSRKLCALLRECQIEAHAHPNIHNIQWAKLILNLNNAVNALSGLPLKEQIKLPEYRNVMADMISEALHVLKQSDIKTEHIGKVHPKLLPILLRLPTWAFTRIARAMLSIDPQARSSMFEDLDQGRETEIDFLNGEIVALATKNNIDAPINAHIVSLVKQAEQAQKGSPKLSALALAV